MGKREIPLGHAISHHGIEVGKAKFDLITNLPPPTCVKHIRSFLGHVGFYRLFIQDFSKILKPLTNLLVKHVPFHLFEKCLKEFKRLNKALTSAPILHPLI